MEVLAAVMFREERKEVPLLLDKSSLVEPSETLGVGQSSRAGLRAPGARGPSRWTLVFVFVVSIIPTWFHTVGARAVCCQPSTP